MYKYIILLFIIFFILNVLKNKQKETFSQIDEGQYLKTLNYGFKGKWDNVRGKQCKKGSWAIGARGRLSEPSNDNTGLEGLQILCSDNKNRNSVVTIENGNKGKWQSWKKCDKKNYMCGARLRVENNKGWSSDDTGANGIQLMCCDKKTGEVARDSKGRIKKNAYPVVTSGYYGWWGNYKKCNNKDKLVGMRTRYDYTKRRWSRRPDNVGINGLQIVCNGLGPNTICNDPTYIEANLSACTNNNTKKNCERTLKHGYESNNDLCKNKVNFKNVKPNINNMKPGCYVKTPNGCPKKNWSAKKWTRDKRGERYKASGKIMNNCVNIRKKDYQNWCGTKNIKMKFVAVSNAISNIPGNNYSNQEFFNLIWEAYTLANINNPKQRNKINIKRNLENLMSKLFTIACKIKNINSIDFNIENCLSKGKNNFAKSTWFNNIIFASKQCDKKNSIDKFLCNEFNKYMKYLITYARKVKYNINYSENKCNNQIYYNELIQNGPC